MSLVAGSYERFIWGFKLKPLAHHSDETLSLSPLFSYPSHLSQIKAVAIAGPVVASGGTDDTIHIYNLSASSSLGSLHHHTATITALSFYTPPHLNFPRNLISAAADGTVCIYDADSFVHLKTISAHRKDVNDLALHPSGKLALTVGRDECLAMLNLVREGGAFTVGWEEKPARLSLIRQAISSLWPWKRRLRCTRLRMLGCCWNSRTRSGFSVSSLARLQDF